MSLSHTSEDSLAQILGYLEVKDVLQLMAVGSKSLNARILQNLTEVLCTFDRPSYFPSFVFKFPKLRTLCIAGNNLGHLSLHNRSLFPSGPIQSLETLELSFQLSHLVFEPQSSQSGLSLSSSFPNLTSLTISFNGKQPLPQGWTESLPQSLTALHISIGRSEQFIDPSSASKLDSLSKGLQTIELEMPISAGAEDLRRFADLRVLILLELDTLDVLDGLTDTLEEVDLKLLSKDRGNHRDGGRVFLHSKFPPKIRIFSVSPEITFEADCMAPPTLEKLSGLLLTSAETMKYFHSKNLRSLSSRQIDMTPELIELLPNIESIYGEFIGDDPRAQSLPRSLQNFSYHWHRQRGTALTDLPASLESYHWKLFTTDVLSDLPRTIQSLSIQRTNFLKQPLSREAWMGLPPKLHYLTVPLALFDDVSNCLPVLPRTLAVLGLSLKNLSPDSDVVERVSFPDWMKETLECLAITSGRNIAEDFAPVERSCISLFPKLSSFSGLLRLYVRVDVVINSDTLAHLPKSLTCLTVQCRELENFGLPFGQSPEKNADWTEGAFSRLPEGLIELELSFSSHMSDAIDFNVFSRLPRRLAELSLDTSWCLPKNLKKFFATLPRRLSILHYSYAQVFGRHWDDEIKEYYSDPFWNSTCGQSAV